MDIHSGKSVYKFQDIEYRDPRDIPPMTGLKKSENLDDLNKIIVEPISSLIYEKDNLLREDCLRSYMGSTKGFFYNGRPLRVNESSNAHPDFELSGDGVSPIHDKLSRYRYGRF